MAHARRTTVIVSLAVLSLCTGGRSDGASSPDLTSRGQRHFDMKEYEEAQAVWRRAADSKPKNIGIRVKLGTALTRLNRYAEAETVFREALAIDPGSAMVHYHLGALFMHEGRQAPAREHLSLALKHKSWYPNAHYLLGYMLETEGRYKAAAGEYVAELNVNPSNQNAMYHLLKMQKEGNFGRNWNQEVRWTPRKIVGVSLALALALTAFVWFQLKTHGDLDAQEPAPAE